MNRIEKRITELERQKEHKPFTLENVAWTDEQLAFRKEIHKRMEETGTTYYCDVCNDEEFERIKKQSTQAGLIYYLKSKMDSNTE